MPITKTVSSITFTIDEIKSILAREARINADSYIVTLNIPTKVNRDGSPINLESITFTWTHEESKTEDSYKQYEGIGGYR